MAVIVNTPNEGDYLHSIGERFAPNKLGHLEVFDADGKMVGLHKRWSNVTAHLDEADQGDPDADEDSTVWVDVLPDITKFREAFAKGVEDLKREVAVDETIRVGFDGSSFRGTCQAEAAAFAESIARAGKPRTLEQIAAEAALHNTVVLAKAGCPCGETH